MDPELAAAFQDITANPANFVKYQNNPKISAVITKLANKFGAMPEAFRGAFPGGFPPSGGTSSGPGTDTGDDVGLD
ncbi:Hsc70-interacting protein [Zootermopsis nevadensis]|uniref:Hsc70-interacting protein n=1 Tax=Zootermopsis nevadensis TaxID=136037 RepID=A0A067QR98_ZOONE|nr:Hsc70-interacting protein [Zootermopsis nevadensis]